MDRITLKNLFDTSLLLEVVEIDVKRSERLSAMKKIDNEDSLSPQSQSLLSYFSPDTQKRLARDFHLDEIAINEKLKVLEVDDPNYVNYNASGVGTYLELWTCVNIVCPGCGGKLYKYANPNMPVIDVKCINPEHKLGPVYYQIKATEKGKVFNNYKYFSYEEEYVSTGSIKYGYNCHEIKANDYLSRDILIGYICIEYKYADPLLNSIMIDMNTSFLLIPNLEFKPTSIQNDLTYYKYIRRGDSPIVTFDPIMINKIQFNKLYNPFGTISLYNYYDCVKEYKGEPPAKLKFQYKYLVMKKKYLNLKKQLI